VLDLIFTSYVLDIELYKSDPLVRSEAHHEALTIIINETMSNDLRQENLPIFNFNKTNYELLFYFYFLFFFYFIL